jgi:hypothetical protein
MLRNIFEKLNKRLPSKNNNENGYIIIAISALGIAFLSLKIIMKLLDKLL